MTPPSTPARKRGRGGGNAGDRLATYAHPEHRFCRAPLRVGVAGLLGLNKEGARKPVRLDHVSLTQRSRHAAALSFDGIRGFSSSTERPCQRDPFATSSEIQAQPVELMRWGTPDDGGLRSLELYVAILPGGRRVRGCLRPVDERTGTLRYPDSVRQWSCLEGAPARVPEPPSIGTASS